jgi:hypothetical protein
MDQTKNTIIKKLTKPIARTPAVTPKKPALKLVIESGIL